MSEIMFNVEQNMSARTLLRPKTIDYRHESEETDGLYSSGTIVLAPVHKGFDITICNALRRVLLGNFPGYAITAFQIDGVSYEFDNINGVTEDVVQIALNLKQIRLKILNSESVSEFISFEVKGPCEFRAGLIEELTGIKVINKEQIVCHVNSDITLKFKLLISFGHNYIDANALKKVSVKHPGLIYIDGLFNPIKKVSFSSEDVIVNSEDYKKVFLSVETDGSIDYRDAVSMATDILRDQLSVLSSTVDSYGGGHNMSGFQGESFNNHLDEMFSNDCLVSSSNVRYNINLFKTIHEIEMPIRAHNAFVRANILYIGDLVKMPYRELILMPNHGRKSLESVAASIQKYGLKFDMDINVWPPADTASLRKQYETRMNRSIKKKNNDNNDW
jgi:DNA-directed RNA polymerase subunit alpha